jgi:hypothetical protein
MCVNLIPRHTYYEHSVLAKNQVWQGFTCLAAQTAENLVLEDLEHCPMSMHLINVDRKQVN